MGHIISHITAPKNADKEKILNDISREAEREGDGYGWNMTWHSNHVYNTREDAEEAIRKFDKGWYDDHAVLFRSYDKLEEPAPTKAEVAAYGRVEAAEKALRDYVDTHHVSDMSAALVTCGMCGSKLATKWMRPNEGRRYWRADDLDHCPVCRNDLRSAATLNRIKALKAKRDEAKKKADDIKKARIDRWQERMRKGAEVKWLIKYEYHC